MQFRSDEVNKFLAGIDILQEYTGKSRCRCHGILFLDPPYHHAKVLGFNDYCDAKRIKAFLDAVPYLCCQSFLDLEPPAESFDHPGYLA